MNSLKHFPLGAPFPNSPHAVVSSLPTMQAVRAYEEKNPDVLDAMMSGYPRFVVHAYIRQLVDFYIEREALNGRGGVLVPSRRAAQELVEWIGGDVASWLVEAMDALYIVHFNQADHDQAHKIAKYLQHVGCGISSRQAEDLLKRHGQIRALHEEAGFAGSAQHEVEAKVADLCGCRIKDVLICSCGMNAFYAAFRAVQEMQYSRGRGLWLQLGWVYLDSGCILKGFLHKDEALQICYDLNDIDALLALIESAGENLSGVFVECPSNPLVQICDLPKVAAAVRQAGGVMIVDPTIASIYNVDVLPYADVLVTSLTKYASHEGDVMIGALAVNPESPHYGDLVLRTSSFYQPPYTRDLARLAEQMKHAPEVVSCLDANTRRVADFLSRHPAVKKVHYAGYSSHFEAVAKSVGAGGAMISIELNGDIEPVYDALEVMKGPSFGTRFTLVCPFMYLAHYDLVTTQEGRRFLQSIGIDPDLIRISVGTEPIEEIVETFERALTASAFRTKT